MSTRLPQEAIDWCLEAFRLDGETVVWNRDTTRGIKAGDPVGMKWCGGYAKVNVNTKPRKVIAIHRLKWLLRYGELPDEIDHIDRDTANNDFDNLRPVTRSQNRMNSEYAKGGLPRGITLLRGKYQVNIGVGNKLHYLGFFNDLDTAISVRKQAEAIYHGEYAPCQH